MNFNNNAWPFVEAKKLLSHIGNELPKKGYVLFETGYGPSGLPHIGTFGEVVRTTMVRKAFENISGMPTRLFCVSDDMDGMRKVPDQISSEYNKYLGLPLTAIPDPYNTHESYGDNMNNRLRNFLDNFGFEYEFISAAEYYKKGTFNDMLLKVLEHYEEIMEVMLPTLGEERQKTYSPFLPICPQTGKVLQVPITKIDKEKGFITYVNELGNTITSEVTNGKCKLQWKPDFGMRWAAFEVDFEMYGKEHLVNGKIYSQICKILGKRPPHQFFYELFLDTKGEKISKSKGNGLTIDEWLRYATRDSLAYFMYLSPQKAKKLYFDVIPKCVDEYLDHLKKFPTQPLELQIQNPVYHIHFGHPPLMDFQFSYSLLLNLVSACGSEDKEVITGYIKNAYPEIVFDDRIQELIEKSINYYHDFVKPHKKYRKPTATEKTAILKLMQELETMDKKSTAEELQNKVYQVGRESEMEIKDWFTALYEILLGASQGPRFGSFIKLYGIDKTIALITEKLQEV